MKETFMCVRESVNLMSRVMCVLWKARVCVYSRERERERERSRESERERVSIVKHLKK